MGKRNRYILTEEDRKEIKQEIKDESGDTNILINNNDNNIKEKSVNNKSVKKIYENGDIYIGEIKDNQRNGNGKITYKNGDVYDGEWLNDKANGYGLNISHTGA